MINWQLTAVDSDDQEVEIDLLAPQYEPYQLKETDHIEFSVTVDEETSNILGEPTIIVAGESLELSFYHHVDGHRVYTSSEPLDKQESCYFYNIFGHCELHLIFEKKPDYISSCTVNILARPDNAELASEMINYITDHLDDAAAVCFSKSTKKIVHDQGNEFKFSRLDAAQEAVAYLADHLHMFMREHRYTWEPEMQFSDRGQPTGPESLHWLFCNLDKLSPACADDANIIYNNRSYHIDTLPKENIVKNTDTFENRVIHSFLYNVSMFLITIKDTFSTSLPASNNATSNQYVRFDQAMTTSSHIVLQKQIEQIEQLLVAVENIKKFVSKWFPANGRDCIQPKMTAYVAKHTHYSQMFRLIARYNDTPIPNLEGNSILLGLKNLAVVYEITSLLMIMESIKRCLAVELVEQNYRVHGEGIPFGGVKMDRPDGKMNNYFTYQSHRYRVELFYEPMIFPYSENSSVGDLVDISDTRATHKYGAHHFRPDFIIRIQSDKWRKPLVIILDAKYKSAAGVTKHDITPLTLKYLLNIHQINENGSFGVSPIQALLLLFAREKSGLSVSTVAKRHMITGPLPVLPQAAGIIFKPSNKHWFDKHLTSLVDIINNEQ
ncbi:MAG: nuclease domain-containing protein [Aeromonas sp.]